MKLSVALRMGRISNLPTVWTNCLAGAALSGALSGSSALAVGATALALSCLYVGGMYLNDAFDREIDARERPERPIPNGDVRASTAFGIGFGLLLAGVLGVFATATWLTGVVAWPAVLATLGTSLVIVFYNVHHKQNRFSPLVMGLCRVGVYVSACLTLSAHWPPVLWLASGTLLAYLIGLTYVAKQENLDRVTRLWPLLFLAVPLAYGAPLLGGIGMGTFTYAGYLVWTLFCVSLILKRPPETRRAVGSFIAGISWVDAVVVSAAGSPEWVLPCALGWGLTLLFQRYVPGT